MTLKVNSLMRLTEAIKALNNINHVSEKEQVDIVKVSGGFIRYIQNPSRAVQIAAVQHAYLALDMLDKPSPEVIHAHEAVWGKIKK